MMCADGRVTAAECGRGSDLHRNMGLTSLYDVWSVVADTWTWTGEAGLYSQLR